MFRRHANFNYKEIVLFIQNPTCDQCQLSRQYTGTFFLIRHCPYLERTLFQLSVKPLVTADLKEVWFFTADMRLPLILRSLKLVCCISIVIFHRSITYRHQKMLLIIMRQIKIFLFILQEEKLNCEVYLSEISQSAWQNKEFRCLLRVDLGVKNQVIESISVMPRSLCSQSWCRQEKALFPQSAFTASLYIQTYHTYFLLFQYFPPTPQNLTYILLHV